jgi:mono/diheme cytochrome c family protein
MLEGIAAVGHHLYPAFPYPYFEKLSRADSDAIYAYLRTVPPVRQTPRPNKLIFPANIRPLLAFWNDLFTPQGAFAPDPSRSAVWNRGGALVHGLGHCGGCHTPKTVFFSDKSGKQLQGETVDNWHAPNLTGSPRTGLGRWSTADIEQFLKTGKSRFGWVVGNMRDVVRVSTSRWTEDDRHAVATYLKSLPASPERQPALPNNDVMRAGKAVYVARCAVCHEKHNGDYPSLARNTLLDVPDATTTLRVILQGSQSPAIGGQPGDFSMPAFPVLADKELADVATYIRNSWGNRAPSVSAADVKKLRKAIESN